MNYELLRRKIWDLFREELMIVIGVIFFYFYDCDKILESDCFRMTQAKMSCDYLLCFLQFQVRAKQTQSEMYFLFATFRKCAK